MSKRIMGISEARRLLPQIVTRVANEGGRVDITRRGAPMVAIVRASDLRETHGKNGRNRSSALSVEFRGRIER